MSYGIEEELEDARYGAQLAIDLALYELKRIRENIRKRGRVRDD